MLATHRSTRRARGRAPSRLRAPAGRFAPGRRFAYSNVGYLLLGALAERLYGKPYGAAVREEIARPLGLTTLGWCSDPAKDTLVATGHRYLGPGTAVPSGPHARFAA